jgi:hypothetical protein
MHAGNMERAALFAASVPCMRLAPKSMIFRPLAAVTTRDALEASSVWR